MKRASNRGRRGQATLAVLWVVLAGSALTSACGPAARDIDSAAPPAVSRSTNASSPVEAQESRLLSRYGLHAAGAPVTTEITLTAGDEYTTPRFSGSKRIGLDLSSHIGERVTQSSYTLTGRSTADTSITALFFSAGDQVVGAALHIEGYNGALEWPLDDRDNFASPPARAQ